MTTNNKNEAIVSPNARGKHSPNLLKVGPSAEHDPLKLLRSVRLSYPLHRISIGRLSFLLRCILLIRLGDGRLHPPLVSISVVLFVDTKSSTKTTNAIVSIIGTTNTKCPVTIPFTPTLFYPPLAHRPQNKKSRHDLVLH